jgi:hypothetical protein
MSTTGVDLGAGVAVVVDDQGEVSVLSRQLALPWREGTAAMPGTAVAWDDRLWEPRSWSAWEGGERWRLVPWPETEVVRTSDRLDRQRVAELAAAVVARDRARRTRSLIVPLLPLIGLLPRRIQQRLAWDHGLPVEMATIVSSVLEAGGGMMLFCAIELGIWTPPPSMAWIILLSPGMVAEGFVRLWFGLTQDEPIGTFVLAWLVLLDRSRARPDTPLAAYRPSVHAIDEVTGSLQLVSAEPRWDWDVDGVLRFRDRLYRLVERSSLAGQGLYIFDPAPDDARPTLSLMPPPRVERARQRGRGIGADILRFTLVAFAPRHVQERLVPEMRLPRRFLTFLSAALEVLGGSVNLAGGAVDDPSSLIEVVLVVEGLTRIGLALASRAPVGSLLGLPFRGLYSAWTAEAGESVSGTSAASAAPQNGQ